MDRRKHPSAPTRILGCRYRRKQRSRATKPADLNGVSGNGYAREKWLLTNSCLVKFLLCQIIDFIYILGTTDDISDATAEFRRKCPILASSRESLQYPDYSGTRFPENAATSWYLRVCSRLCVASREQQLSALRYVYIAQSCEAVLEMARYDAMTAGNLGAVEP
jgi:hypothetical protein